MDVKKALEREFTQAKSVRLQAVLFRGATKPQKKCEAQRARSVRFAGPNDNPSLDLQPTIKDERGESY